MKQEFIYPLDGGRAFLHIYYDGYTTYINIFFMGMMSTIKESPIPDIIDEMIDSLVEFRKSLKRTEIPPEIIKEFEE